MRYNNFTQLIGYVDNYSLLDTTEGDFVKFEFTLAIQRPIYDETQPAKVDYVPVFAYNKVAHKARAVVKKGLLVHCQAHLTMSAAQQGKIPRIVLEDIKALYRDKETNIYEANV
ncbi:single-stranded DNA-binding protein [Aerococcaceae bacterium NML191292]|nr:single-stranded DNA-binding protein [Aerococcaceae bacterium NML191292]